VASPYFRQNINAICDRAATPRVGRAALTIGVFNARLSESFGVYHLHQPFGYFRSARFSMVNLIVEPAPAPKSGNRPSGDARRGALSIRLKPWADRQS
jgi:hypothetical protein